MSSPDAIAVVQATVNLRRSHPHAPPLDVLDVVMKGREGQELNFLDADGWPIRSLAHPADEFGQVVAAALDQGMDPGDWVSFTSDRADPVMRETVLDIWKDDIMGTRFAGRYKVKVGGLP